MEITVRSLIKGAQESQGIVVIIDVFRCFTTEAVAFDRGAEKIILVSEIEEALELRERGLGQIIMGEVGGKRPEGFDYGNSPFELASANLRGKTIIQSTRAGTVGVTNVSEADVMYGGSLAVAGATVRAIASHKPEKVSLVAMGLEGRVKADEDEQCALYLRNLLQGRKPDKDSVRALILAGEESQKYDDPSLPQWPLEDRMMALDIDSHNFALRIAMEGDLFVARPEYV
ncbi:MAG: 2-phosphosulfolactate phosphatase [Chloroflexota bacterium]|jgi:2-phosphosulfolactate phosphatase|nr:2-phosphosulfolactate phosphatase [Chloroflexota bacterium]